MMILNFIMEHYTSKQQDAYLEELFPGFQIEQATQHHYTNLISSISRRTASFGGGELGVQQLLDAMCDGSLAIGTRLIYWGFGGDHRRHAYNRMTVYLLTDKGWTKEHDKKFRPTIWSDGAPFVQGHDW